MTLQGMMCPVLNSMEAEQRTIDARSKEREDMRVNSLLSQEREYTGVSYTPSGIKIDRTAVREFGQMQC